MKLVYKMKIEKFFYDNEDEFYVHEMKMRSNGFRVKNVEYVNNGILLEYHKFIE